MAEPNPPRDEALKRFDQRYEALAETHRRKPRGFGAESGAGAGYRLIGELVGGVLTGLGLGWVADRLAGTQPWGLIVGLLAGTGVAIFMIVRSAGRMSGAQPPNTGHAGAKAPAPDQDEGPG
jgi:ATP synthase protein I